VVSHKQQQVIHLHQVVILQELQEDQQDMANKTITIKMKNGKTRKQAVKVLASGKYKFIKNTKKKNGNSTKKGGVRKTARRAFKGLKKKVKRKANKPRKNNNGTLKLKSLTSSSTLKKVALGVGGAAIASAAIGMIAPNSQFGRYAAPAGAYLMGSFEGLLGSMALSMFSRPAGSNANLPPAAEVL